MRYNVHPPRAFRNRIAKYLGVLVVAALIATLGLPSAAQAQTIPNSEMMDKGIVYTDAKDFTVNWDVRTRLTTGMLDNWIVTLTRPNGAKVVVDQYTTSPDGIGPRRRDDQRRGRGPNLQLQTQRCGDLVVSGRCLLCSS